ncbi:MAG: DUF4178 domain-containing protein [Gemmatimonadota bacterium]|nr:DUF4178 domain-containing protein [Gemmatimonadota bacterium]
MNSDETQIRIGRQGRYRHRAFTIVGRLQLQDEDASSWNEWYLLFDEGLAGWLSDGDGTYAVTFETEIAELDTLPAFESLRLDQELKLNRRYYDVSDLYIAVYAGADGDLPFDAEQGTEIPVADLAGSGKSCATIDYSETPPIVFIGENVDLEALRLA